MRKKLLPPAYFYNLFLIVAFGVFLSGCGGGKNDEAAEDTTAPIITLNGNSTIILMQGEDYNELGATATDNSDTTVSININGTVDTSVVGSYTITYTATDSANNTSAVTRAVNVVQPPDTTPPLITMSGNTEITLTLDEDYIELGATATDDRDTIVNVVISGTVDTSTPGSYTLFYDATDSAGNIADTVSRTINVFNCSITKNNWVWIAGNDIVNQAADFGAKGVATDTNLPGSRQGSVSWTDSQNNLWMFGGSAYGKSGWLEGVFNALWKFDGANWIWVSGSSAANQQGNYGIRGEVSSSNVPGARWAAVSWIDKNDNLWLFGGQGYDGAGSYGYLNDLWKFDGSNWIWVSGSQLTAESGTYGIKNITSPDNFPGARFLSSSWIDDEGNLWLFGGHGYDSTGTLDRLNDLWKFDGSNWTWISGSNLATESGIYGTKNITSPDNSPGARYTATSWIDHDNNLWLFGGNGYDSTGFMSNLNDLWKFNGVDWVWVSGSNVFGQATISGSIGVYESTNIPGARSEAISWTDKNGNFWLFGGYGRASTNVWGSLNDLWKFDGIGWIWVSGDNLVDQAGVYGLQCSGESGNKPGARRDTVPWIDSSDNLWLLGGVGYDSTGTWGLLNDLWRYSP